MANKDTWNTWSKSAFILTGVLLLIVKTEYYWKQIVGLIPLVFKIIIALLAIAVVVMMVFSSIRIYRERGLLHAKMFVPIAIYFFGLAFSFADPFNLNAESIQSKALLKGHFSAIMNTAKITFRQNGRVEFEGNGFLGYTYFYDGNWKRNGDTLTTKFASDAPIPWGDHLIIYPDDKLLLPPDSVALDQHFPGFLLEDEQVEIKARPHEAEKSV